MMKYHSTIFEIHILHGFSISSQCNSGEDGHVKPNSLILTPRRVATGTLLRYVQRPHDFSKKKDFFYISNL